MSRAAAAALAASSCLRDGPRRGEPISFHASTALHGVPLLPDGGACCRRTAALSRARTVDVRQERRPTPPGREHEFLFGALGDAARGVSVGAELWPPSRPSMRRDSNDAQLPDERDVTAAFRHRGWTAYGELGRQPRGDDAASPPSSTGSATTRAISARAPAASSPPTASGSPTPPRSRARRSGSTPTTRSMGELSYTSDHHLLQVVIGKHADVDRVLTASGRWQFDSPPRTVLVARAFP